MPKRTGIASLDVAPIIIEQVELANKAKDKADKEYNKLLRRRW